MAEGLDKRFQRLGVGSSDASVYVSSAEDFEYPCNNCTANGDQTEASGYCVECAKFLCITCIKRHFKDNAFKGHLLFNLNSRLTKESDITTGHNNQNQQQAMEDNASDYIEDINNLVFLKTVNVKTGSDTKNCFVVAMVVLSDQLLAVADANNKCVKIININLGTVISTLTLRNNPLSMTQLPQAQLAVTIANDYCINIISTQSGLNVINTIRLEGRCYDIAYFEGKLLVSIYTPLVTFQVLDMNGIVLESVVPGHDVTSLCTDESFIAFRPDKPTIFISDMKNKICLSVDMKGKKVAECKELACPTGFVCPSKLPYNIVCDRDKHLIRKLTMDLKSGEILLNQRDGLFFPYALCVSSEQRYLIVSSIAKTHCDSVMMYRF